MPSSQQLALLHLLLCVPLARACFPAIFNFGDSTSDTGGIHAAFPKQTPAEFPPYGQFYYGKPSNRYSDGRLLIDFLAEAFGIPPLDPYLQSVNSNFQHGANFATAGATVLPLTYLSPFPLGVQVLQFYQFLQNVVSLQTNPATPSKLLRRLPQPAVFSQALYTIALGGNDFTWGYTKGQSITEVRSYLPQVVDGLVSAVKALYAAGGRYFIVWDIEPHGCLPYILTLIPHTSNDTDEYGCLVEYNQGAIWYNDLLRKQFAALRQELPDISVHVLSTFDIKYAIEKNASVNGFLYTLKACCGVPSLYNYNLNVNCGKTRTIRGVTYTSVTCSDPDEYFVWDGVHNTEAAGKYIGNQMFSGNWFDVPFPELTSTCGLKPLS